jgi:hypothetical protein
VLEPVAASELGIWRRVRFSPATRNGLWGQQLTPPRSTKSAAGTVQLSKEAMFFNLPQMACQVCEWRHSTNVHLADGKAPLTVCPFTSAASVIIFFVFSVQSKWGNAPTGVLSVTTMTSHSLDMLWIANVWRCVKGMAADLLQAL